MRELLFCGLQGDEAVLEAKFLTSLKEVRDLRVRVDATKCRDVTATHRVLAGLLSYCFNMMTCALSIKTAP